MGSYLRLHLEQPRAFGQRIDDSRRVSRRLLPKSRWFVCRLLREYDFHSLVEEGGLKCGRRHRGAIPRRCGIGWQYCFGQSCSRGSTTSFALCKSIKVRSHAGAIGIRDEVGIDTIRPVVDSANSQHAFDTVDSIAAPLSDLLRRQRPSHMLVPAIGKHLYNRAMCRVLRQPSIRAAPLPLSDAQHILDRIAISDPSRNAGAGASRPFAIW